MLKQRLCSLVVVFVAIVLISSVCFATDNVDATVLSEGAVEEITNNTSNETVDGSETGEVTTTEGEEVPDVMAEDNYINTDYFKADTDVVVDTNMIIDGNAYIAGENVTIKGRIVGDLFVVAKNLTIEGAYVYTNVFACASNITIKDEGVVYNLYAVGQKLTIDTNAIVYRDLTAACSDVTIKGAVGRDAKIDATTLSIIPGETDNSIYGNLTYSTPKEAEIPEGAVSGEVKYEEQKANVPVTVTIVEQIKTYAFKLLKTLIITSIVFLFVAFLMNSFSKKASDLLTTKAGVVIGLGFASLFGVPVVSLLLLLTIVGIPVSAILFTIYGLLIFLSQAILSAVIANIIMSKLGKEKKIFFYLFTLAVSAIIFLLQLVPYLGGLITLAVIVLNLGICTRAILPNKKEKLAEPEVE